MELFKIGKIINTHGIKGEVKVQQLTDFRERFDEGNIVFIRKDGTDWKPLTIRSSRIHKNNILLQFESYETLNDVEPLKNELLYIKEEQLTPLEEDEFYYFEIIGLEVETIDGKYIGKIDHILSPGANDVWVVKTKNNKEILIPYIEPVVKEIHIEEKKVIIEPMEGLFD
ncbi:ribosome maturation factor RimM [Pseudogracilibacillus sp. ICA-222130]|uniref:ribosome maturation factor RimM n=1 Tax=Pseudogracilibacillus sp. ICA-222130 TaxID=3134655 RepID=UPI0030C0C46E